jgi:hypothetical protein
LHFFGLFAFWLFPLEWSLFDFPFFFFIQRKQITEVGEGKGWEARRRDGKERRRKEKGDLFPGSFGGR